MNKAEQVQRLEVDVDTRLSELWALAWERDTAMCETLESNPAIAEEIGALMRAAYGKGYCDALQEDSEGRRGELSRANGYKTPPPGRFTT